MTTDESGTTLVSGGRLVAECLAKEGASHVFCVPGESYLAVLDAFVDFPQIQVVSTRHEGGAAFMAEAHAKSTGRVGVCMATRAVGAANLAIGLHTAKQDSTPIVAILGQVERAFSEREAFQEVHLAEWFRPLCKWAVEIRDVARIPELLQRAFTVAQTGRPGPVVVALPHDLVDDVVQFVSLPARGTISRPAPHLQSVEIVHARLTAAKRPVMIVGGGVLRAKASEAAVKVAERYQMPTVTAFRRFDAFPNLHPCYAGWLGFGPSSSVLDAIRNADFVLAVGTRLSQVTSQDYQLLAPDTPLTVVDVDGLAVGSAYGQAEVVQADAGEFLDALCAIANEERVHTGALPQEMEERVRDLHTAYLKFSTPRLPVSESSAFINLDSVMADFSRIVPSDTIITSDAGNFFGWVGRFYRFSQPGTYIGPTSGAMGYGLPAAIGAKMAHPDRVVVSFSGDGGFMMTLAEMETACRTNTAVICIVVNNGLYGTIRAHQERHFPGRVMGTVLGNPSFAAVARDFGGMGIRVERAEDFAPALERALTSDRFALIEVMTDPNILSVGAGGAS